MRMLSLTAAPAFAHGLISQTPAPTLAQDGADVDLCNVFAGRDTSDWGTAADPREVDEYALIDK